MGLKNVDTNIHVGVVGLGKSNMMKAVIQHILNESYETRRGEYELIPKDGDTSGGAES